MSNIEKYQRVFCELFNVEIENLNEEFTFANIDQWDSMAHLTLINELEENFDVMFETDDILHFGGYLNGIEILKRYGIEF
ncbi:acyl carrier protein [Ruminococcus albus]|uniref:Acyl carrier protein n=1 Tax=Ruminococcus albus TaxID=1264 RepID=A0A1I1S5J8_RUMAL|nr:acyl carrier protein [Ruminococcus albus]SFD41776.1 Acyl carrier protein [Ruminococcus albus]